jgi:hypothetical protein
MRNRQRSAPRPTARRWFGLDCETTAGPAEGAELVLPTSAVATGFDVPAAAEPPPVAPVVRLLTAANSVFGVARLARLGLAAICFVGADAIGACPVGVAVPAAARTPTVTAAVIMIFLVAIVIAHSFPLLVPSIRRLANRETSLSNIFGTFRGMRRAFDRYYSN